jgi:hypothetical protein
MRNLIKTMCVGVILIVLVVACITIYTKDSKEKETREALTEAMEETVETIYSEADNIPENEADMIAYMSKGIADRINSVSSLDVVIYGMDYEDGFVDAEVTAYFKYIIGQGSVTVRKCIYLEQAAVANGNTTLKEQEKETTKISDSLSYGKSVTSSTKDSEESKAENIVDENSDTEWISAANDGEWVVVDLAMVYKINQIKIYWGKDYPEEYEISISKNNEDWTDTWSGGTESIAIDMSVCRYVKIEGVKRLGNDLGFSIKDVKIYAGN